MKKKGSEAEMSYIIPEGTRKQWKKLADASGSPYAKIVGQHVYDIQGLVNVLTEQVAQAKQPATALAPDKLAELEHKLAASQEQLAAYQQEQQHPTL